MRQARVTKDILEDLYLAQHLTMQEIGDMLGLSRQRICQLIKYFGIDTSTATVFHAICDHCSKPFIAKRGHFKQRFTHFCSPACYYLQRASMSTYVVSRQGQREARTIMETQINRRLTSSEVVHHIDGDCNNNDISNLMLFISHSEHLRFHHQQRIVSSLKPITAI
jgi:hypothetical protein